MAITVTVPASLVKRVGKYAKAKEFANSKEAVVELLSTGLNRHDALDRYNRKGKAKRKSKAAKPKGKVKAAKKSAKRAAAPKRKATKRNGAPKSVRRPKANGAAKPVQAAAVG